MIEGPKGAKFLARRKAKENEPENEHDEPVDFEDEEFGTLDDSPMESATGDSVIEGLEEAIRRAEWREELFRQVWNGKDDGHGSGA